MRALQVGRRGLFALALLAAAPLQAATVTLVPGNGFADSTPKAPEGGNTGTTLGAQRTIVFQQAAAVWGAALTSTQTIKISAAFNDLACNASSGVLGSAGATDYLRNAAEGVVNWHAIALYEAITGDNENGSDPEINANFNAKIDANDLTCLGNTRWYYGITGPAPAGTIALYPVVLHEIGHGLGFAALICSPAFSNCGGPVHGQFFDNVPDIWATALFDNDLGKFWADPTMSNAQRAASFTNDPDLVWAGQKVTGHLPDFGQDGTDLTAGRLRMNAPATFAPGSSISHFNPGSTPNLLMEPSLNSDVFTQTDLTDCLFADIGWINSRCVNRAPTLNVINNPAAILEDAAQQTVNLAGIDDADNDTQILSIAATSDTTGLIPNPAVTYTSPNATGSLAYTPVANQNGSAIITVTASDNGDLDGGGANSRVRTFTVNVTAVNDAPILDADRSPVLAPIDEDSGAPTGVVGTLVSALVDLASVGGGVDNITEVDAAPLLGIAITAADASNGAWFHSTNGGGSWNGLGAVSGSSARHLIADANTRLYFQPTPGFAGTATITFRAWDRTTGPANGALANPTPTGGSASYSSATDTASITVNNTNDTPTSTGPAGTPTANEDAPNALAFGVADVDGGSLTVSIDATQGTVSLANLSGLSFSAGDGSGDALVTFTGTIAALNTAIASVSFQPVADFNGGASVTLAVTDGTASAAPRVVNLIVTAVADIVADAVGTNEDAPLTFNALTGTNGATADTFENPGRVVTAVTQPANGSATFAANGELTYTPPLNFNGPTSFNYTVTSGGVTESATVSVTVNAVNDPPSASNLDAAESFTEDGGAIALVDIVAADVDSSSVVATLALSDLAAGTLSTATAGGTTSSFVAGTWTANGPIAEVNALLAGVTFTPSADFASSFIIGASVSDGTGNVSGSKFVTAIPANDAPAIAAPPILLTGEDTALAFTGPNTVSVSDIDGDNLTVTLTASNGTFTLTPTGLGFTVGDGTADATMTFSGSIAALNAALGTVTLAPLADFNGGFGMTSSVSDGIATSAPVGGLVIVNAVADTVNDLVTTARNTPLTINVLTGTGGASADNFENAGRTLTAVGTPTDGDVSFEPDGRVTYTPDNGFEGADSFSYTVTSGGVTETGNIGVTVVPPSAPPQATNLSAPETYTEDTALDLVDIVVTDDTPILQAIVTLSPPAAGSLGTGNAGGVQSIYDAGTGIWNVSGTVAQVNAQLAALAFEPAGDANGAATLTVRIQDEAQFIEGSKALTGTPVADAADDQVATLQNTPVTFNVLTGTNGASADDFEGVPVLVSVTQGAIGTVTFGPDGTVTYTPDAGETGGDVFTYTVQSGGATETANVAVNVVPTAPEIFRNGFEGL